MNKRFPMLRLGWAGLTLILTAAAAEVAGGGGAQRVSAYGFEDCIELSNATTRVVLTGRAGARVLSYQLNQLESLYQDRTQDGRTLAANGGQPWSHPAGGRFDIGPEVDATPKTLLWLGEWTGEITGPRSARYTSAIDPVRHIQIVRQFFLAADTSHLRCVATIRNVGATAFRTFHWGRTFAAGGGIALAPVAPHSRFPAGYVVYESRGLINFRPAPVPSVRVRDGLLEIIAPPPFPKFALDVGPGWLGYVTRNGLFFLKKFAIDASRPYGEPAANNASIWYYGTQMTEIEPIGPSEVIAPGASAEFTEEWWLHAFPFPSDGNIDHTALQSLIDASQP